MDLNKLRGEFSLWQHHSLQLHLDEETSSCAEAGSHRQTIFLPQLVH